MGDAIWDERAPNRSNPPVVIPPITGGRIPIRIASNIRPFGMSYWRNINNHAGQDNLKVFISSHDELVILTLDKISLQVLNEKYLNIYNTGEGCYFSAHESNILFIPINDTLFRCNIDTGGMESVWISPNRLWQCHSSYDETIHSATLKDSNYNIIGWGLSNGNQYEIRGNPDECQIDKSGKWLLIKEDNYNRIVYIPTGAERKIDNERGALGHSDIGFGIALGENDFSPMPGALDEINFVDGAQRLLYSTGIWNMGYVSFTNAPSDFCLITTPSELIKVYLDGRVEVICNNLTEPYNGISVNHKDYPYENRPKANLCPLGEYAAWTAYVDGSLNGYVVRL